ncbi:hypothetical protein GN157_12855 [Flavobacterium rakeshii]|uniref:Uncharacterized protein n=1 Tax=Flavobacterium rakeshii TaxID=1038845 RepID=A0A6N8HFU9_9FLAO|nr:hypothetical protein [Flavobacterium rakeshii]MUV04599.1 hypothetical protein [Flavobacterium rakeshii]
MKYIEILNQFDASISAHISEFATHLNNVSFDTENGVLFTLSDDFDNTTFFSQVKKKGVYLFELNLDSDRLSGKKRETKIKNFAEDWSKKKHDSFFSSSVIKKRLSMYEKFDKQWLPLYIGKNKDIYKRILEHINLSTDKNTYAMKLKHRKNLHGLQFRVSVIEIDVINYDFIVPHIERILREKYHPLIGKQ